jgi:hypothetical protein
LRTGILAALDEWSGATARLPFRRAAEGRHSYQPNRGSFAARLIERIFEQDRNGDAWDTHARA